MKIIDPHLHLFDLTQGDYTWLKPNNPPFWPDKSRINRHFNEADLTLKSPLKLAGFVHIEAGFNNQHPWREIDWLEQHCQRPFKSIAFADLSQKPESFIHHILQLQQYASFVGIRHILDMDNVPDFLLQKNVQLNLSYLAQQQLIFECQLSLTDEHAVEALIRLLTAIPLTVIINHAGFPPSNKQNEYFRQWQRSIEKLSAINTLAIKCSGFEMNNRNYQPTDQHRVIECCLRYLGNERVMLASNFPLTLFSHTYQDYWQQLINLSLKQQHKLLFSNSYTWYQFN